MTERVASPFATRMALAVGVNVEDYMGASLPGSVFFRRGQLQINGRLQDDPDSYCIGFEWVFPNKLLVNPLASSDAGPADALLELGAILPCLDVTLYFLPTALAPSETATIQDGLRVVTCWDMQAIPAGMSDPTDPQKPLPGITAFRGMMKVPLTVLRSHILGLDGFPTALTQGLKKVDAVLYVRKDLIRQEDAA